MFISKYTDCTIFLVETHSEHLMLRILRRIEETTSGDIADPDLELKAEHVSVVYVEPDADGVKMNALRINENARFTDRWPHGFFDERAEDII